MYKIIKAAISKIIPRKILFQLEPYLRSVYAVFFRGKNHKCTICNYPLNKFITLANQDFLCPKCGSLARDRRLWKLLENEFLKEKQQILDFSPSRCLSRKLRTIKSIDYKSSDLSGNFMAQHQFDITKLVLPSNTLDLVICYHILEHVDEDLKAMNELYRVLKSDGKVIIQTPFKEGEIYENSEIKSPNERLKHFGQEDHLRIYSASGLKKRLENVGFNLETRCFDEPDVFHKLDLNETILIATKM